MSKGRYIRQKPQHPGPHIIDIVVSGKVETFYRAQCSCGEYRSKLCKFPGLAEAAGRAHVKARGA